MSSFSAVVEHCRRQLETPRRGDLPGLSDVERRQLAWARWQLRHEPYSWKRRELHAEIRELEKRKR